MSEGLYLILAVLVIISYLLITAPTNGDRRARQRKDIGRVLDGTRADMDRIVREMMERVDRADRP